MSTVEPRCEKNGFFFFCICEKKDAYQLRGNREADQRLCFRYTDSFFLFLFWLWFNFPVNNFSVMLRRSNLFLGITSTFGE